MVASSLACIVALVVSVLGLARAVFDVTWPLGRSGVDEICLQVGGKESAQQASTWDRSGSGLSSRSPRLASELDPTITPMPPTATLRPTATPLPPTATRGPVETPLPPTPTPVPSATLSTTVPISTQVGISATTDYLLQAPILLEPVPDAQLQSGIRFQWLWDGQPLPEGLAFDLLIWSEAEDQEHQGTGACGVVETDQSLERDVDLDFVGTIADHGGGTYFWTVIMVQEEPYERVGAWGEKRSFTYVGSAVPAEPTTESP